MTSVLKQFLPGQQTSDPKHPSSRAVPTEERAKEQTFTLPDLTPINVTEDDSEKITISLGQRSNNDRLTTTSAPSSQQGKLTPIIDFTPTSQEARSSLHNVHKSKVFELNAHDGKASFEDIWAGIYGFWVRRDHQEYVPVKIGSSFTNAEKVCKYLLFTGLGMPPPDVEVKESSSQQVLLSRSAFWQGGGAPLSMAWMRSPQPHPAVVGDLLSTNFPHVDTIKKSTGGGNEAVKQSSHPVRPPKPPPGALLYSRYVHSVGAHLQLYQIDPSNDEHVNKISSWKDGQRFKQEWQGEANDSDFLQKKFDDPHTFSFISSWDGQYVGYGELSWGKEDDITELVDSVTDYDQTTKSIIGDENYLKKMQCAQVIISEKHFCFLRESRTDTVFGESQAAEPITQELLETYLPQDVQNKGTNVVTVLHRDRFFAEGNFY